MVSYDVCTGCCVFLKFAFGNVAPVKGNNESESFTARGVTCVPFMCMSRLIRRQRVLFGNN